MRLAVLCIVAGAWWQQQQSALPYAGWAWAPAALGLAAVALRPAGMAQRLMRHSDPALTAKSADLVRPGAAGAIQGRVKIEIKSQGVNLRRCGDTSCPTVGTLAKGVHSGVAMDETGGWVLVIVPDRGNGWVSRKVASVAPAP